MDKYLRYGLYYNTFGEGRPNRESLQKSQGCNRQSQSTNEVFFLPVGEQGEALCRILTTGDRRFELPFVRRHTPATLAQPGENFRPERV
jgi:hypothetical protein